MPLPNNSCEGFCEGFCQSEGFCCQQTNWRSKLSVVTEAYQQRNCLFQGRCKFCSSEGYSKLSSSSSQSMLILSLRTYVEFLRDERRKEKGDAAACTID